MNIQAECLSLSLITISFNTNDNKTTASCFFFSPSNTSQRFCFILVVEVLPYVWEMTILEGAELPIYLTKGKKKVKIMLDIGYGYVDIENQYSNRR